MFRKAEVYIKDSSLNNVIVEIGTAHGPDSSTQIFNSIAQQKGTVVYTVDLDDRSEVCDPLTSTVRYQMDGSSWATDIFPTLNKQISLLYLDNYDYDYRVGRASWVDEQKKEYQEKYNINLNNLDCTVEHLKQMIALLPYMAEHSTVICDDTYLFNGCWIGKCGAVVPYLVANGFSIIEIERNEGSSYAVALAR